MIEKLFGKRENDPREISNADAAAAYEGGNAVFVDVREADEWASGHIPNARFIPLGDLASQLGELSKDDEIITVCRSGRRSLDAVNVLKSGGFEDVKSMAGGMIEWSKQGRPVE